jgi:hypothetical protein
MCGYGVVSPELARLIRLKPPAIYRAKKSCSHQQRAFSEIAVPDGRVVSAVFL